MTPANSQQLRTWLLPAVLPAALAAAFVTDTFAASAAPLQSLWRPLLVVAGGAAGLYVALAIVSRRPALASLTAASVACGILAVWVLALVPASILAWWMAVQTLRRARHQDLLDHHRLARVVQTTGGVIGLMFALSMANAVYGSSISIEVPSLAGVETSAGATRPNIFFVLLDGYPRRDVLQAEFGISNEPFTNALETRGFSVAMHSRSNYPTTQLTLASMLNARYVEQIPDLARDLGSPQRQERLLSAAINHGSIVEAVRKLGYRVVTHPSAFTSAALYSADDIQDTGAITQLEEYFLRRSVVLNVLAGPVRAWIADNERRAVVDALEGWVRVAGEKHDRPTFMFTHVISPHPPFLLAQARGEPKLQACYPEHCGLWDAPESLLGMTSMEYARGLRDELVSLNDRMLAAVDQVIEADPTAIIILFSDHGTRHLGFGTDESFHTFFAARTPGATDVFPNDISPVNVFPSLFNRVFHTKIDLQPYAAWTEIGGLLELVPASPAP